MSTSDSFERPKIQSFHEGLSKHPPIPPGAPDEYAPGSKKG